MLGNDALRHFPRMQLESQPIDLDHRIGRREILRFLQRADTKDKDAAQVTVVTEP